MGSVTEDRFMHTSIKRTSSSTNVLLNLFVYSCGMFTLPFVAYYGVVHLVEEYFHAGNSFIWGTAAAVVVVHVLIGMFVWGAYKEVRDAEIAREPRVITKEELVARQKQE